MFMRFCLFLILIITTLSPRCNAQNFGLEFASYKFQKDLRTGLNLNPEKAFLLNKDLELSFKLSLYNRKSLFGYVVRAVINDTLNIDIQTNYSQKQIGIISVIIGQRIYNFPSWSIEESLFQEWEEFKIKFKVSDNQIIFVKGAEESSVDFKFPPKAQITFNFGAIGSGQFITTDVPSMRIKDASILRGEDLAFKWLLKENSGNKAFDSIKNRIATVENPHWLGPRFSQWKLNKRLSLAGIVVPAFNDRTNEIYFLTSDSLLIYSLVNNQFRRILFSGKQKLTPDSRIIFDHHTNTLYHYNLDNGVFVGFDSLTRKWESNLNKHQDLSRQYTQHNGGFSKDDSSFYFFGGYGFHKYKNELFRYHIPTKAFSEVTLKGDNIPPRYLSSMNFNSASGYAYLLGGYGSLSGDQRIHPQSFKDLYLLDLKKGTAKKVCNLNSLPEDYCFARSFYMFEKENCFYALGFSQHKYLSWLKLIKGDTNSGNFNYVGDSIPFLFEDIRSVADLYFSDEKKELVCLTALTSERNDSTQFEIYTIQFPPNFSSSGNDNRIKWINSWMYLLVGLILAGLTYIILKVKRRIVERERTSIIDQKPVATYKKGPEEPLHRTDNRNSIFFLGKFQLFDKDGEEISNLFSPLLKELFLLVFFYSHTGKGGISTEMLNQFLWFDKDSSQARNNRSVNMSKLRYIINRVEGISLEKRNGYWYIDIQHDIVRTDYLEITKYLKNGSVPHENISGFIAIVKSGSLLPESAFEWLDKVKSEFANDLLDLLIEIEKLNHHDHDLSLKIADAIFVHDSLNEDALRLKYNTLIAMGRHHLAKTVLEQFKIEYLTLYGEPFEESRIH